MKLTEYGTITEYGTMKITEYTKINRREVPRWDEETLKKHPEWSEDKDYEYTVDGIQRKLWGKFIELCEDYTDCHIITIENEKKWMGYYDTKEEVIFVDTYFFPEGYNGITKKALEALTQYLEWDDYTVYVRYYDYEESVLAIQKED